MLNNVRLYLGRASIFLVIGFQDLFICVPGWLKVLKLFFLVIVMYFFCENRLCIGKCNTIFSDICLILWNVFLWARVVVISIGLAVFRLSDGLCYKII